MDVKKLTIEDAKSLVKRGETTYEDIHRGYLALIEENKDLNAFLSVIDKGNYQWRSLARC